MSNSVGSAAPAAHAALSFVFVVATTSLSFFMGQLDVTIVTVALPRIAAELHAGLSDLQWVVDAYTLAFAVAMLSAGALGDRLGVRRGLQLGMGLFAVASLACASAPSATWLTLARVFQGVGAAAMLPNSLALLNQSFSHDGGQRAKAVGWWTASGAVSLALGPLLGGLLLTAFGWRWIFLVNLPVCALGLFLVARFPKGAAERLGGGLDITGQLCAAAALTLLTAGIIGSGHPGPGQRLVWLFLATAALCAVLFVVVERRSRSPVLPRQLFAGRSFLPAVGYGMVMNFTYYGSIFMLSIFLQDGLGYSPMRAGMAFLPLTAGFFISNVVSGSFVTRFGARLAMLVGSCIDALGFALLLSVSTHSAYSDLALGFLLIPLGMGLGVPAMTGAVLGAVPNRLSGTASALLNTARQACGAVGVAVLGAWAQGGPERIAGSIRRAALLCILLLVVAFWLASRVGPRATPEGHGPQGKRSA